MAILASELRIGNLIYDDSNTPLPVEYIHRDVVGLKNSMGGTDKYQTDPIISGDINKLSPIPLTEEWLVRFGFSISNIKTKNAGKVWVKGSFSINIETTRSGMYPLRTLDNILISGLILQACRPRTPITESVILTYSSNY